MEKNRRRDIFIVDVHRASFAKFLRSKKQLENTKHEERVKCEWLFQELIVKIT